MYKTFERNQSKGHNSETKKGGAIILVCNMVTELWSLQEYLEEINQRGVTLKLRKREQSFLCAKCRLDLRHIPIKLHEDIPDGY